uniref:Actin-related protein 2/3 complex subunit n=1 Tax=Strongyloides stercoralis TaxID=6248 RepID=A0A0K0ECJ4_STRER
MDSFTSKILKTCNFGIGPISCHAWNADKTQLAVSASSVIYIYSIEVKENKNTIDYCLLHTLLEHDLAITGLDWGSKTNRIVSCSQDKNAFVWTFDKNTNTWKPELVLVRINRAATCIKWAPLENKFAVGSGAKVVSICYYEKENDWWVSKQLKKPIKSTVNCITWHPNNCLIGVGACDFKGRIFSAYIKEVDEKPSPTSWGNKMPFGQLMAEYNVSSWILDIEFSPCGSRIAWVSHNSTLSVVDSEVDITKVNSLKLKTLPLCSIGWIRENKLIGAGYDYVPMIFKVTDDGVSSYQGKADDSSASGKSQESEGVFNAFQKFQNIDRKGTEVVNVKNATAHQNAIRQIVPFSGKCGNYTKYTTCGADGLVCLWMA